jgi:hypothetical protein
MDRTIFMSLGPTARASKAAPFSDASAAYDLQVRHPWYLRPRWTLSIWAVLSMIWGLAVCYDLCQRVSMQADMSRDVEKDLDQGFVTASCGGPQCGGSTNAVRAQNWSRIASTFIKFGGDEMAECVLGPPAAVLVIGLGTVLVLRRRPASGRKSQADS